MKLLLPIALLLMVFSFCSGKLPGFLGLENKSSPTPEVASNTSPTPTASVNKSLEKIDDDDLKARLIELENEWKEASRKGDRDELKLIFAEEFTNVDETGKTYDKYEWLNQVGSGDPELKSWTIVDAKIISNAGDKATMSFVITHYYKTHEPIRTRDTDNFVFRDDRWQVVSSQSTLMK